MGHIQAVPKVQVVQNRHVKDSGGKKIFGDPTLCAEFLRGYTNIDLLKDVKPEDIEDISERFISMWQEERDSDTVKKIHLKNSELIVITIVEHQSRVYYDTAFRMLLYMVMVLVDYQAEQEKKIRGITRTKDFKYPPILPIVFYEGTEQWTAVRNFKDRVHMSDILGEYIPDFQYLVVPIKEYSKQELIEKQDELSLIFLINRLKSSSEFKKLKDDIPEEYFKNLRENTPEYLLKLISQIIAAFLYRIEVPREEVEKLSDLIIRRDFDMLFDGFEEYSVTETRRISRKEGNIIRLVGQIKKKCIKGKTIERIADEVEEEPMAIQNIYDAINSHPDATNEEIFEMVKDDSKVLQLSL